MFYREAGDFKTTYSDDNATFPIKADKFAFWTAMAFAFCVVPFLINGYWANAIFIPFLVFSMAALGLNLLQGYCGQVSLGTGGFMCVGAYSCYKLITGLDIHIPVGVSDGEWQYLSIILPEMNIVFAIIFSGVITALVGILFGLPSLRIKGFYLAVATLAAQFFLPWLFNKWEWSFNYSASGQITAPDQFIFGTAVGGSSPEPWAAYLLCLCIVFVFGWIARNLVRGRIGRSWMAIRDMDIAAEIIGVNPLMTKLSAFAVSSFYIGVAGAMYFVVWKGSAEGGEAFSILISFEVLFMVIIGGLGSIMGTYIGAAFIVLLPVFFKNVLVGMLGWPTDIAELTRISLLGSLIIFFLIAEPHGIAALWRTLKEKLRLWPFPH